ncbi:hypothetical protein ACSBR2_004671 [Camellia fascicularis]
MTSELVGCCAHPSFRMCCSNLFIQLISYQSLSKNVKAPSMQCSQQLKKKE